jgi:hypothetical protein
MSSETAIFWLVVAAFLFFDNLIIVPNGCDLLRLGRDGVLRYEASSRLTAGGREVVLLNPLNLFDRALVTTTCFGNVDRLKWRDVRAPITAALPILNIFCAIGYLYLVLVVFLPIVSFWSGFTLALIGFVTLHLVTWLVAAAVFIFGRHQLQLRASEALGSAAEALFVPGYLINLGKRLLYKKRVDVSSLGIGLRDLKRFKDCDDREELALKLLRRLEELEITFGHEVDEDCLGRAAAPMSVEPGNFVPKSEAGRPMLNGTQQWIQEVRICLKT